MKAIVKILIFTLIANLGYAGNSSIKGEWKGSYIINANVRTINIYINYHCKHLFFNKCFYYRRSEICKFQRNINKK